MNQDKFSLIIVDSIMALFRTDYIGRGQLSERQQLLNSFLAKIKKLGDKHNVGILMTN